MLCVARDTARRRAGMPAAALDQAVAQLYARVADVHRRTAGGGNRRQMIKMTRRAAHDLNNLLQIISGNAELLTMDLAPAGANREAALAIADASQRAAELTRHLLACVRDDQSMPGLSDR
jgi:signal transduction histidine kinase